MFDGDVARKERSNSISKPAMVGVRTERSNSLSKSSGYGTLEPPDHGSVDSDEVGTLQSDIYIYIFNLIPVINLSMKT